MHGKVTAVKFAGVESLIEVVDLDSVATTCLALVLELEAVLPHAWTIIHCIVARSIIFIQDKNCSGFTVMKSVAFEAAVGTFVPISQFFLPLVFINNIVDITILHPLIHFFHSFSLFFCADFEVFWRYRSSIGVLHVFVYLVIPILAQGFNRIELLHHLNHIVKRGNLINQFAAATLLVLSCHTLQLFDQVFVPLLF